MGQRLGRPFQFRGAGSVPGLGAKMPYASRPKTKQKEVWGFSVQRASTGDAWASLLLQSHDAAGDRNPVQSYRLPPRSEALLGSCVCPPPSLQLPSVPRLARVPLGPLSLRPHPRASLLGRWQLVTVLLLMVFSCCDSVSLSFEEGCCCCCC